MVTLLRKTPLLAGESSLPEKSEFTMVTLLRKTPLLASGESSLPEVVRKAMLVALLDTLVSIHRENGYHGRIRPWNVLFLPSGQVTLTSNESTAGAEFAEDRWYWTPERLLSYSEDNSAAADMWAVGCLFAELICGHPFFLSFDVANQLYTTFKVLGFPRRDQVPYLGSEYDHLTFPKIDHRCNLGSKFHNLSAQGLDFLSRLLQFDASARMTAIDALNHSYLISQDSSSSLPSPLFGSPNLSGPLSPPRSNPVPASSDFQSSLRTTAEISTQSGHKSFSTEETNTRQRPEGETHDPEVLAGSQRLLIEVIETVNRDWSAVTTGLEGQVKSYREIKRRCKDCQETSVAFSHSKWHLSNLSQVIQKESKSAQLACKELKELLRVAAALYREAKLHRIVLRNALEEVNRYFCAARDRSVFMHTQSSIQKNDDPSSSDAKRSPDEWLSSAQRRKDRFAKLLDKLVALLRDCGEKIQIVSEYLSRVERWAPYARMEHNDAAIGAEGSEGEWETKKLSKARDSNLISMGARAQSVDADEAEAVALLNPEYISFTTGSRAQGRMSSAIPAASNRVAPPVRNTASRPRPWRV